MGNKKKALNPNRDRTINGEESFKKKGLNKTFFVSKY